MYRCLISRPFIRPEDSLHTAAQVRKLLDDYITAHSLVHPREKKYIILDDVLRACLQRKNDHPDELEFLSRQEANERLQSGMQAWHEIISGQGAETTVRCAIHFERTSEL
jgi:hypothetical protein